MMFRSRIFIFCFALVSIAGGQDRQATTPVNFNAHIHAHNAAAAADVAEQAATVAKRVAVHTDDVVHATASALRYTQDALRQANADGKTVAELGKQADSLESEAGITSGEGAGSSAEGSSRTKDRQTRGGISSGEGVDFEGSSKKSSHTKGPPAGIDVNSAIEPTPNGVEPFGQEEPAKQLTKTSVKESDRMVRQIETAQGVESKRAVYRALTKLRGATITSYDGMAKAHLKNVDTYNKQHNWREEHPYRHLAEEEADTHVWAFPKPPQAKQTQALEFKAAPFNTTPAPPGAAAPAGVLAKFALYVRATIP